MEFQTVVVDKSPTVVPQNYNSFFNDCNVPKEIKKIAVCIMKRFTIFGLCDGMYISNVIAMVSGLGDGKSHFTGDTNIPNPYAVAEKLQNAYGCNIQKEDIDELTEIIRTGTLDKEKTKTGLRNYIQSCYQKKKSCEDYRTSYLTECITKANITLHEI